MGVLSGPQPGPGLPAVTAVDPRSPEPPTALGDSSVSSARKYDATISQPSTDAVSHQQPTEEAQGKQQETAAAAAAADDADAYESRHVHTVYEAIAPHFSSTRYKPWPLVASFLLSLPPGSVGLDAGCGNGKYIGVNPALYIIASDRSANLISLARSYQPPHFDAEAAGAGFSSKKKNKTKEGAVTSESASASAAGAAQQPPAPARAPNN
ncbi:hypothetical protein LZ30DRAFT_565736, partial [Colletotrichum cereale]